MHATQEGDSAAYLELLQTVTPYLRRIVAHRRGFAGREDVEDLVQDILLSLHAVRASYDPRRPFTPWLLAIVRHRLADGARRYARTKAHEVEVDDERVTFPHTVDEVPHDHRVMTRWRCDRRCDALPRGQREAIELIKLQGLSLKEAAAATGSTVGALKVATHRALAALRIMSEGNCTFVNTERLIERLALDVERVRPLRRPWMRAALWSVGASLCDRADADVHVEPRVLHQHEKSGVRRAAGGRDRDGVLRWWRHLRRWSLVIRVGFRAAGIRRLDMAGGVALKSASEWRAVKLAGLADPHELLCVLTIALTAVPPALALVLMLRQGVPLNPRFSMALSLLAAAGVTNVVTCLASPHQSALAVLVWHGATLLVLSVLAARRGRGRPVVVIESRPTGEPLRKVGREQSHMTGEAIHKGRLRPVRRHSR